MDSKIERKVLREILAKYKDMSYLWDKHHVGYKNQGLRQNGFQILFEMYKTIDENATINTVKKKILNMRTNYFSELKKVRSSNNEYVPTLWYYDAFSYMSPTSTCDSNNLPETTTTAAAATGDPLMQESNMWSSDGEKSETGSLTEPELEIAAKRAKITILKREEDSEEEAKPMYTDRELEIIGKAIGYQLRGLSREDMAIAQKLISDVIFLARTARLTVQAHVVPGPSYDHHIHM